MDHAAFFGSGRDRQRASTTQFTVRRYKGAAIPWQVHDCENTESCRGCRRIKREHVAAVKTSAGGST